MDLLKNILKLLVIVYLMTLSSMIYAQDKSVDWINKHAYKLRSDTTSADQDLRFLSKILKGKNLVGLGEASHGTQEFYFQKGRIVKYLVRREKYRVFALESPTTYIEPINNYIQTGKGDLKSMLKSMGLYNSDEFYQLCQWLKSFNESQSPNDRVKMLGFDDEQYWSNPVTRDEKMAESFIKAHKQDSPKSILWAHNLHLAKDTTMTMPYKGMGFYLKKQYQDLYYMIGFDTYSGTVSILNNGQFESQSFTGTENTFSALFNKANYKAFFVDFHKSPNPFLNTKNLITNIYSNRQKPKPLPIIPGADFDALIFIRQTTASKEIE
jgi:erythromycin esterase-like protein